MLLLSTIILQASGSNLPPGYLTLFNVCAIIVMVLYSGILLINLFVVFKFKIYKNTSSMFIVTCLILLALIRLTTVALTYGSVDWFLNSQVLNRLTHDVPGFLFDCVTIALLLQFTLTYDVLADTQRALDSI